MLNKQPDRRLVLKIFETDPSSPRPLKIALFPSALETESAIYIRDQSDRSLPTLWRLYKCDYYYYYYFIRFINRLAIIFISLSELLLELRSTHLCSEWPRLWTHLTALMIFQSSCPSYCCSLWCSCWNAAVAEAVLSLATAFVKRYKFIIHRVVDTVVGRAIVIVMFWSCLLYTSDAADE